MSGDQDWTIHDTDEAVARAEAAADAVETILRSYGIDHPTQAERRAYVAVLDRMGTFARSERDTLRAGGML